MIDQIVLFHISLVASNIWSDHHLLLFTSLLFFHLSEAACVEALEATKYKGAVLGSAHLFINWLEWARYTCLSWGLAILSLTMVVYIEEHWLVLETSSLHESFLELSKLIFALRWGRVKHKDDSMGSLLDWAPTLLIAPITGNVPEFDVNFSKNSSWSWRILFILNNPIQTKRQN